MTGVQENLPKTGQAGDGMGHVEADFFIFARLDSVRQGKAVRINRSSLIIEQQLE